MKEIRTNDRTYIIGEDNIQKEIRADFQKRFKKEQINHGILEDYLRVINNEVSTEENEALTKTVTNAEIKKCGVQH